MSGAGRSRSALVCRFRDHDDAVTIVVADLGAAVLACDRCERRRLVPYRGAVPPTMAEHAAHNDVAVVDRAALEGLLLTAEVGASMAGLLDGDRS